MTTPRGRTGHVRPRPPSTGRPSPTARNVKPKTARVRQHRGLEARRRRLPMPTRLLLGLSVLALAGAVFLTATGGIGSVVGALGAGFASALDRLIATPAPTQEVIVATGSPIISSPDSAYTNGDTLDLRIIVPADAAASTGAKVRIYLALKGLKPTPIRDVPVSSALTLTVPVDLTKGRNDFTATIIRGGVESEPSPVVTIYLDKTPPKVTVTSPKTGTTVDGPNVTIEAKTEANATIVGRDDANGVSVTAVAGADGAFEVVLPMAPGTNAIHLDVTDQAGNASTTDLSYLQGSGKMTANLASTVYRISVSNQPSSLRLTVIVTDPTGAPLAGSSAAFTLQIPGLAPISGTATTGADGRASFTTPLVGKIDLGNGQATVLVTDPVFGETTDHVGLTFVK